MNRAARSLVFVILAVLPNTISARADDAYPATRRVDQVDTMHGVRVEDPYRWLEQDVRTSPEVAGWVAAQNKVTGAYLARIPERATIKRRLTELWNYIYLSFATPPCIFRHNLLTGKTDLWRRPQVKVDSRDYVVKQIFYRSKDGTRVPMFITHQSGVKLDGNNPAFLYGYGGFKAISPYHNLKPGGKYPATLVTTADTDDRLPPLHSFKFIAQLQHCQAGDAPVLLHVETSAGHGTAARPTFQQIDEAADRYAFLVKNLGMTVSEQP